ncbi:ATP-binding cassette domain-containing protein [Peribacillus simplex]|uniref:ATP-binding cassette domain-containing protein n=1 Tax=Peribacillus simplex TaxID=1478 RepID=UPI0032EA24F8
MSKAFSGQTILKNIQLQIEKGKTVGIVGSNGSGKSVLFKNDLWIYSSRRRNGKNSRRSVRS